MSANEAEQVDAQTDTERVAVTSQARELLMRAAKLRIQARQAPPEQRLALWKEADELESHAFRMTFGR